jgi:hypothetical protein
MTEEIAAEDEIARCLIFPKAFQNAIHTDEVLLVFGSSGEDGASHESGVLCRLAPTDREIHCMGCGIALRQNERASFATDSPKRRFYCGFRKAIAKDIAIRGDKYSVTLTLDGEGGEAAHVDLALRVESDGKNERATIKAEVALALAEVFGPAVSHICECDLENERHPLKADPECLVRGIPRFATLQTSLLAGE